MCKNFADRYSQTITMLDRSAEKFLSAQDIRTLAGTPDGGRKSQHNPYTMSDFFMLDPDNAYAGIATIPRGRAQSEAMHWVPCQVGTASSLHVYSEASLHHTQGGYGLDGSQFSGCDQMFEPCSDCQCRGQPCSVMQLAAKGKMQPLINAGSVYMRGNVLMVNWEQIRRHSLRERAELAAGMLCI